MVIRAHRTWTAIAALGLLAGLAGCAAVLGLEPTNVIAGNGEGGITGNVEGGISGHPGGDTPAFDPACASAITTIDANGEEANAIVADANGLFWSTPQDSSTSFIRANTGSGNRLIVGTQDGTWTNDEPTVVGLALDTNNLYWSSWDTYDLPGTEANLRSWARAGGKVTTATLSTATTGISEIAIGKGKIYFGNWLSASNNSHIYSIPVNFTASTALIDESGGLESPLHFAGNDDHVFYDEATNLTTTPIIQDEIGLLSTSTGNPTEFSTGLDSVEDIAVGAGNRVYWAQGNDKKIGTYSPDDGAGVTDFVDIDYPHFLAYDADHQMLYVGNSSQDDVWSIQRIPTNGSGTPAVQSCVGNLDDISAVQYFGGHLYFSAVSKSGSALFDFKIK